MSSTNEFDEEEINVYTLNCGFIYDRHKLDTWVISNVKAKGNDKNFQMSIFRTIVVRTMSRYSNPSYFVMLINSNNLDFIVPLHSSYCL